MRVRTVALVAALATAGTALAGCASTAQSPAAGGSGRFVVAYSQSNNAEPYRAQLNIQLRYYLKKYSDVQFLPIADAKQSSATQVSQVQQFVQRKVDALIVSPNEPAPLTSAVEQACRAKIPVVILDRSVNTDCYSAFIGGDNYVAGQKAGRLAVSLLPHGGNVGELQGILSDQPQIDRDRGFRDAIKDHPDIHLVAHREAKWLKDDATRITGQWLAQGTKLDLVYAQNDPMALGGYLAASSAGKQKSIKFIGTDGLAISDGGIRAVQQHKLAGTFIYPTCAKQAAETVEKLLHHKKVAKKTTLDIVSVTPSNAAALYRKNDFSRYR